MTTELLYRGIHGSLEYSDEDNVWWGKLLNIRALVTYEGDTLEELVLAFEETVDHYLETLLSTG